MRSLVMLAAFLGALAASPSARAQTASADTRTVVVDQVAVRSGGSEKFYATGKLQRGQKVEVLRDSPEYPGWLVIKPPPGSFSWINARFVQERGPYLGVVVAA